MKNIEYKIGIVPKTSEIIEVYDSSGIKRPTKDSDRITKMYKNSNLIITAWLHNELNFQFNAYLKCIDKISL